MVRVTSVYGSEIEKPVGGSFRQPVLVLSVMTPLKRKSERQLQLTREVRLRSDLAEAAAAVRDVGSVEQGRVGRVQSFRTELGLEFLRDAEVLEQRGIEVDLART